MKKKLFKTFSFEKTLKEKMFISSRRGFITNSVINKFTKGQRLELIDGDNADKLKKSVKITNVIKFVIYEKDTRNKSIRFCPKNDDEYTYWICDSKYPDSSDKWKELTKLEFMDLVKPLIYDSDSLNSSTLITSHGFYPETNLIHYLVNIREIN